MLLYELAKNINNGLNVHYNLTNLVNILSDFDIQEIDLDKYDNLMTYYKDIIYIDDNIEIVVIYWPPGSKTEIHNHPKNGCIMRVIQGCLKEDVYVLNNLVETNYIYDLAARESYELHRITNTLDEQSISVHVYSPPNHYKN